LRDSNISKTPKRKNNIEKNNNQLEKELIPKTKNNKETKVSE